MTHCNAAVFVMCGLLSGVLVGCGARSSLLVEEREPAAVEVCNGLDDDGDGRIDEDIPPQRCGLGGCMREVPGCVDGVIPTCVAGSPMPEVCDGSDNNCNGSVDEGLGFGPVAGPFKVFDQGALWLELVNIDGGMLATWNVGFNGSAPTPSVVARRLDLDGIVDGPVVELLQRPVTQGPRARPSVDGGHVLTYCGRFGANDFTTSAYLSADGIATEHGKRAPTDRSCGAAEPEGLWTGSHHLFAWTDNSSGPIAGHEVLLDVADDQGQSLEWQNLDPDGDLSAPPRLAVSGGRVGLLAGLRPEPAESWLSFQLLSSAGEGLAEPLMFAAPFDDSSWGGTNLAASAAGGFVGVVENRFGKGVFHMRFGADGSVIQAPTLYEGIDWTAQYMDMEARPGGGFVFAGGAYVIGEYERGVVMALADDGSITHQWFTDDSEEQYIGFAAIAVNGGRVFVFYSTALPDETQELRVREFGCVQP